MTEYEPLLTTPEVASMFGVKVRTVSKWARTGRLPSTRTPRGLYRFREPEVLALLAGSSVYPEPGSAARWAAALADGKIIPAVHADRGDSRSRCGLRGTDTVAASGETVTCQRCLQLTGQSGQPAGEVGDDTLTMLAYGDVVDGCEQLLEEARRG